ncbi:MAG: RIP metalloprotease RseP [Burkholderiaceae bacterium]
MLTLFAFLLALTLLIFVHEMGHYLAARYFDVKVLRFSIGFGKPLFKWTSGPDQTEWAVGAIPLGGYVAMVDERAQDASDISPEDLPRAFTRQTLFARSIIVVAGPVANFLLAIVLYASLGLIGVQEPSAILAQPAAQTPAAQAGLQRGDRIESIGGDVIRSWNDVRLKLLEPVIEKADVPIEVRRDGAVQTLQLSTRSLPDGAAETDFMSKLGVDIASGKVLLGNLLPDGAAVGAGLETGDKILMVAGNEINRARQMIASIRQNPGQPIDFVIERQGETLTIPVVPAPTPSDDPDATNGKIGLIGASLQDQVAMELVRHGPIDSLFIGAERTVEMSLFSLRMFGKMITGDLSLSNLSGPVTIAGLAGDTARVGWFAYISFLALISISLGVLNLLPIPVLDGGHLVYYAIEAIRGKPLSDRVMEFTQKVGVGMIMVMMSLALFNDMVRLIT